jgi:hypothetical protein
LSTAFSVRRSALERQTNKRAKTAVTEKILIWL